jgi:hypothetical protein
MVEPMVEDVQVEPVAAPSPQCGREAPPMGHAGEVKCVCVHCGHPMMREKLAQFNRAFGIAILVLGILLSFFVLFVGLPLVVIGAYMGIASRAVWTCLSCGAVVDRHGD